MHCFPYGDNIECSKQFEALKILGNRRSIQSETQNYCVKWQLGIKRKIKRKFKNDVANKLHQKL